MPHTIQHPVHQTFTPTELVLLGRDAEAWRTGTVLPRTEPPPPARRELTTAERRAVTYAPRTRALWGM